MDSADAQQKKILYGLLATCLILVVGSVYLFFQVAELSEAKAKKVGYVRSDVFLANYRPAVAVQKKLIAESKAKEKTLQGKLEELQNLDEYIKRRSQVLTTQALAPQISRLQTKQSEYMQLQQMMQQEVSRQQAELLEPIFKDISTEISTYGEEQGYSVILGTPMEGVIVFGDPILDLTDVIIERLHAKLPPSTPVPLDQPSDTTKNPN